MIASPDRPNPQSSHADWVAYAAWLKRHWWAHGREVHYEIRRLRLDGGAGWYLVGVKP